MSDQMPAEQWLGMAATISDHHAAYILEHLRSTIHDDSAEGAAYRDALGLTIDTKRLAKWTSQDWGAPFTEQQRVVSEWSVR